MGHPNPLCPVHDTNETLIGCPCNDVGLDDDGLITVPEPMPKLYSQEHVDRLTAENERLRKTLDTAYLMVKVDATDAPGRISTAIRPFLEAAVAGAEGDRC